MYKGKDSCNGGSTIDDSTGKKFSFNFVDKRDSSSNVDSDSKNSEIENSDSYSGHTTKKLWGIYTSDHSIESKAREELILRYINYAANLHKFFIGKYLSNVNNTIVSIGDLNGAALLGLIEAIDNFDISKGVKFKTFAFYRIVGAMFDCLRQYQHVPRSVAKNRRELKPLIEAICHELGKIANSDDIIDFIRDSSNKILDRNFSVNVFNNCEIKDEMVIVNHSYCGEIDSDAIEEAVIGTLKNVDENDKMNYSTIIYSYYYLGLNTEMIALLLDCSEALVTKRKKEAIRILKCNISRDIFYYD